MKHVLILSYWYQPIYCKPSHSSHLYLVTANAPPTFPCAEIWGGISCELVTGNAKYFFRILLFACVAEKLHCAAVLNLAEVRLC